MKFRKRKLAFDSWYFHQVVYSADPLVIQGLLWGGLLLDYFPAWDTTKDKAEASQLVAASGAGDGDKVGRKVNECK